MLLLSLTLIIFHWKILYVNMSLMSKHFWLNDEEWIFPIKLTLYWDSLLSLLIPMNLKTRQAAQREVSWQCCCLPTLAQLQELVLRRCEVYRLLSLSLWCLVIMTHFENVASQAWNCKSVLWFLRIGVGCNSVVN